MKDFSLFGVSAILTVFSLVILSYILLSTNRKSIERFDGQQILKYLVISLIVLLLDDTLGYYFFEQTYEYAYIGTKITIFLYYVLIFFPPFLWCIYMNKLMMRKMRVVEYVISFLPLAVAVICSIISLFTPCIFYVSKDNVYSHGPLFVAISVSVFIYSIYVVMIFLHERRYAPKNATTVFLMSWLIPLIAYVIQLILVALNYPSLDLTWYGMVISILFIFVSIQSTIMAKDTLTGLPNRARLDQYITSYLMSRDRKDIYGFMLDLDRFKSINDNFGHIVGDEALESAAKILLDSFPKGSFISRYAGDEFVAIVESSDKDLPSKIKASLLECEENFNNNSNAPYNIHFSIGHEFISKSEAITPKEFIRTIDSQMYIDKNKALHQNDTPTNDGSHQISLILKEDFNDYNVNYEKALERFNNDLILYSKCFRTFMNARKLDHISKHIKDNPEGCLIIADTIYDESNALGLTFISKDVEALISALEKKKKDYIKIDSCLNILVSDCRSFQIHLKEKNIL